LVRSRSLEYGYIAIRYGAKCRGKDFDMLYIFTGL
jgi:hypothetical protein